MENVMPGLNPRKDGPGRADLLITVTRSCQFRCRYCTIRFDKRPVSMSSDILKKSVEFLFTSRAQHLELQFFGGEPLLRFDLVSKAILHASALVQTSGKLCRFSVTTNALSIGREALKFFKKWNTAFLISFDGMREIQEKNRPIAAGPGTGRTAGHYPYRTIIENIFAIRDMGIPCRINLVVMPEDASLLEKNVCFLRDMGLDNIQVAYAAGEGWDKKASKQFVESLSRLIRSGKNGGAGAVLSQDPESEPVLVSPQVLVDTDASVYTGCAYVLERSAPGLFNAYRTGSLYDIGAFDTVRMTRRSRWNALKKALKSGQVPEFVLQNMALGLRVRRLLRHDRGAQGI